MHFNPKPPAMNTANPRLSADFDELVRHARHCSRYFARLLDAEPELLNWLQEYYRTPCDGKVMQMWSDALPASDEAQTVTRIAQPAQARDVACAGARPERSCRSRRSDA
jgi:hypothetical protein